MSNSLCVSPSLSQQTKRSKVNPLRSSHLSSGAADSLLFMAHPEGLSTNGIHMISISSGRQEPAFQHISFLLWRTQSRHRATAGGRKKKKKNTQLIMIIIIDQSGTAEMEFHWPKNGPLSGDVINNGPDWVRREPKVTLS